MNTCGLTRLLVPGFLVGLAATSLTGDDRLGWVAAAATVAVLLIVQRVRGTGSSCAVDLSEQRESTAPPPSPTIPMVDSSASVPSATTTDSSTSSN